MKKIVIITFFTLLSAFILCGAVSAATGLENSSWPKYHHDNNNTGQSDYKGPQTNHVKWIDNTGKITSVDAVYIGTDNTLYLTDRGNSVITALNPNKTLKWKYKNADINTELTVGNGGTIYFGGWFGNVTALNPDGTLKWKYHTGTTTTNYSIYSAPAIGSDGTIYVVSNAVYALNPSGTLKWKYTIPKTTTLMGYSMSSPAIGSDGTIYFGSQTDYFYALNRNGTLKWRYKATESIFSSPSIGSDGTIYFGSGNPYDDTANHIYALNRNGTLKWKYSTNNPISEQTISKDGIIYFTDSSNIYALNSNGTLRWKYNYPAGHIIIGSDGTIYVTGKSGAYALNTNGILKWQCPITNIGEYSQPIIGSDGTLYFGVEEEYGELENFVSYGYLYAIQDIDVTAPTASANIKSGLYNTTKNITLSMSEPGTIYYTTNGITPTTASTKYTRPITIASTTTLKFIAVDNAGNISPVYTEKYTIDKTAPKITLTSPKSGATGVSRTSTISIKFSENIKASVNLSKIIVKNKYGNAVSITKWISGNTLYIKTSIKRLSNSYYTVYIPASSVKDNACNNLAAGYTFKFKTGA